MGEQRGGGMVFNPVDGWMTRVTRDYDKLNEQRAASIIAYFLCFNIMGERGETVKERRKRREDGEINQ